MGVVKNELVIDVEALGDAHSTDMPDTMLELIDAGKPALNVLSAMLSDDTVPVNNITARFHRCSLRTHSTAT